MAMKVVLVLLVLCAAYASAQIPFTSSPAVSVGTATPWVLSTQALSAAAGTPSCSNGLVSTIDPCQVQQFTFTLADLTDEVESATQWISFRFRYAIEQHEFQRAYDYSSTVSIHYGETSPGVDEPSNILNDYAVSPFKLNEVDGEYEWNLHCSFNPGLYTMTVRSASYVQSYNSSLSANVTNATEAYPFEVQICAQSVNVEQLAGWSPFCDGQCLRSVNGPFTVQSFRDQYAIGAPEHLSAHFAFVAPTVAELGDNQLSPGLRLRVFNRVDRADKDFLGLWVVTVKRAEFTSAAFAHPSFGNGYATCPWDFASGPELRYTFDFEQTGSVAYQPDGIDIWIPRCTLEVGQLYYVSVMPPHTESLFDYDYTFDLTIEVDQLNPAAITTLNTGVTASFDDQIEGFLVPFGQVSDLSFPERHNQPDPLPSLPGSLGYPLSLPLAPLSMWDEGNGPVDRYERAARWYALDLGQIEPYSSLNIVLSGAQWGRRTDDGQWNQLAFNSLTPPGDDFYDYAKEHMDTLNITQETWLRPQTLDAAMQRFTWYDVDSMRNVDLFVSTTGLPLGELHWVSELLRYQNYPANVADWFKPVPLQNATGWPNATLENHYGTHVPLPDSCPTAEWSCTAYPDRQHKAGDGSTSSCRITMPYCQLLALQAANVTTLYVGVAPTNLIWAEQDRVGQATVGPAAPFEGATTTEVPPRIKHTQVQRIVTETRSGNTRSPSSGNWDLVYTLQDMDLRYHIEFAMEDNTPTALGVFPQIDSAVEVSLAQQGEVDYYTFSVANQTNNLTSNFSSVDIVGFEIELYTQQSSQNVWIGVYYFADADPLQAPCSVLSATPLWQCSTANTAGDRLGSCVFVEQGCDFEAGNYLLAVSAVDDGVANGEQLSYTLKASYLNPTVDLPFEQPTNQIVRSGSYNHYIFDVPADNQTVALRVHVGDVQGGKVTAFMRYGGPAGDNQCLLFDFKCQPSGGYHECNLVAPYCIDGAGQYYVSVYGEDSGAGRSAAGQIAYVLTAYVHRAEWVDWMPAPDANDPASAVHITRSIPAENTYAGIVKFADDIVKTDVRYNFWNDNYELLNPALPGLRQPVKPVAGFRPFGYLSFGMYGAGPNAVLAAEAHYYYFELSAAAVAVPNGTSQLVSSVVINSRQAHGSADTLTLYVSPYAIANDMCNCWSCVAAPGEQSYSHCDIVLQQCDLLADDNTTFSGAAVELWYLTVRYDQYDTHASLPVDYTLDVQLKGAADVQLADGVAVYGAAASNEYQHYFFVPGAATATAPTSLNVEFYIARDAVDQVEFTMNVGQRAGSACSAWGAMLPSCQPAPVTQGNSQASYQVCSFKLHPCEFDATAVYWFSVVGTPEPGASQFGNGDVEYTLRVWTEAVAVLDALVGTPVSGVVAESSNVYSVEITADFFDSASPRHLFVQLDGIIGGQVRTWLSNGVVGTSCSESGACPGDRRPFDGEFEIELDNCQLTVGDVYYLVVSASAIDDPLTPVRYTLRAYTQTVEIIAVGASLFGRDLPTPAVSLSLDRLESVSLQIDVAGALQAELSGLTAAQQLAVAAASSLHVRVFDVTWGSFEYWVSQLPSAQGTTSFGSYPFGLASPECNSQYGGITGQAGASEPDIEHVYNGANRPLQSGVDFDAVRTFGYIPPDELYLRMSCDIKSLSRVYVTLKAAVTPEWHRLPCERKLNASVEVWLETPTLLVAPGDVWTFSVNGATDHEALTWVQAPENLTIFGDQAWANNARLLRPTQLIWSRTYADEYKLFAYPIDFSTVESVGIYLTADRKVAPSFDYPRNPRAWGGLGIPKDTVFGDEFLYYWLFVPTSQLQSTVGNSAVPGRMGDSCGFAPEHNGLSSLWTNRDDSDNEALVLTACEYDYQPGVFFLAVRYPVERPLATYVAPAVAVAWQFPNTVIDEVVVEQFPTLPSSTTLLANNLENTIRISQNYSLGTYDQLDIEIVFPEDYDTAFPYWSYTVRVTKLFKGSQSVPLMAWQYGSAVDLVPLPVIVRDSTTTNNNNNLHSDNDYLRGSVYRLPSDEEGQCVDYFDFGELPFVQIGSNTPCCRQSDLRDSRSLWLSFANSRQVLLQRDAPVPPIDDVWDEFDFEVTLVLTPFYLSNVPLFSTEVVTIGQDNWVLDTLYSLRTYQFTFDPAAGYFNFDALLTPSLNGATPLPGANVVSAWLSYETPLFNPPAGYGNFLDESSCFYGGELICTLDLNVASTNNETYPNNPGACAYRNACRSGPSGIYFLTFRWNTNDIPGSAWPQSFTNGEPDANIAWRMWQSDNLALDLSTVDHDSTTGLLPAFEVTSPQFDIYQNFEITLPSPDPTTDYSRFVYQNPAMLWFEVSYTNTSEFYAQSCAQLEPISGDCLSGSSLETLGWNCTNFVFDAPSNNYNYNCTLRCEIPLCVLDGIETLRFSVGNFDSNLHNASDLTFTAGIDSYLDRAQQLTDGVFFSVNSTEANLTDVEYQFYFDYVPAANPAAELAYLEFALQNVSGWFADGVQVVMRVWPEYLCETTVQARTCAAVPQSYDRFGAASCLISFDPCEFDQTRPARFFISTTIGVDNNTVTVTNPAFGLWPANFTYDVLASTRYPTLVEDALTLDASGAFSTGYVLFNSQELGSEQHHYRFDLANFAADYDSLQVCVSVSCEAAESVSPYKWELELNSSSLSDGNWTPPFEPYLTVRQPVSLRSNQYATVTESYSTYDFVATYSGHASLHAFLHGDNATTTNSHVTLYLYQYEFNASSPLDYLVSAQLIWRRHTVQLTAGVPYVLVASSQEPLHQYAFSVKYLYDPIVDFSVNARYFNWQNHWATPACNEHSVGLYGATKWEDAQSSACYTLSACEVQSGDLYVSLVTHNRPYPFLAYDNNVNNDVRYELTVTGTARPKPQLVPVNQWASLDQLQLVGDACSNSLRTEIVVPLTGLEWGNVVNIEARTSTGAQLVRACPRWRTSNLFSVLDAANPLDHASAEYTPNSAGNDVQGGPCDDYSQCTLLTATGSQLSADEYYYSGVLSPCHFDNAELYVAFETSDPNTVVRVSLDNGRVPVYDLTGLANPLANTGAPQQQAAGQWQFYKLVLPASPVELSVSLLDRVGGDSLQLTLSADASVPLMPGDSCFDLTTNCPANSDVDCSISVPWCESSGTTAYYVGVYARSTVDAIMSYSLQASLFPDSLVQLTPCSAQCFNVAKGTVAYVELTSSSPLHESMVLFDVRDLTGVVEIAVQQEHLPGAHPDCHIGASWLIDSSDYTGDDVVPGDLRFFKTAAFNPINNFYGYDLSLQEPLFVQNQTLASYDLYPDARSYTRSRPAAEFSAFRYTLPCLDDAVTYLAFFAHEDATFSFSYRVESLITAANTLVIPTGEQSTEIGWRSSPLEGFVENHLVPFGNSLLNDFSACSRALAQSGQWPHLYKWDYTSANAAARQSFGWSLVFLQNAELTTLNRGVLVVNENRVAAPVLAAAAEQNPDTPGLNPLALALAHLDGCSVYPPEQDIALLQPAEEWSYFESCDLTARTFYFYVLFDYNNDQLVNNDFPFNTTDGRSVSQDGTTSSFTSTFTNANPWTTPGSTFTASSTSTSSTTSTTETRSTTISSTASYSTTGVQATSTQTTTDSSTFGIWPSTAFVETNTNRAFSAGYSFEYVLTVELGTAATVLTVGSAPTTIRQCSDDESLIIVIDQGTTTSFAPLGIQLSGWTNGVSPVLSVYEDTCDSVSEVPFTSEQCNSASFVAKPDGEYWLELSFSLSLPTNCEICTEYVIEAFWDTDAVPSLYTPTALTGSGPVFQIDDSFAVTSFNLATPPVATYSLPASVDFVHVRLAALTGQNVLASLSYAAVTAAPFAGCSAEFDQTPFYTDDYDNYWLRRQLREYNSTNYAHGLYGECEIYVSPDQLADYAQRTGGASFFLSALLDHEAPLGVDIASLYADYHIEVTTGFTPLPAAAATYSLSGLDRDFFSLSITNPASIVISVTSISGPAIKFSLRDSMFADDADWVFGPIWCSAQTCDVELNALSQLPTADTLYVFIDRGENRWQKDSVYSIGSSVGRANSVAYNTTLDTLPFCSVIQTVEPSWFAFDSPNTAAWDYGDFTAKDDEAAALYESIIGQFWGRPSAECVQALAVWSCFQTIREVDSNGFVLPVCAEQCYDVVAACGEWTTSAALPQFDCGSTRYVHDDTDTVPCSGSNNRTIPFVPPPPFYINGTNTTSFVYSLSTTTGTTTTTTSSTSSTTTTGTDGHITPFTSLRDDNNDQLSPKEQPVAAKLTTAHRSSSSFGFLPVVAVVVGVLVALALAVLAVRKIRRA